MVLQSRVKFRFKVSMSQTKIMHITNVVDLPRAFEGLLISFFRTSNAPKYLYMKIWSFHRGPFSVVCTGNDFEQDHVLAFYKSTLWTWIDPHFITNARNNFDTRKLGLVLFFRKSTLWTWTHPSLISSARPDSISHSGSFWVSFEIIKR